MNLVRRASGFAFALALAASAASASTWTQIASGAPPARAGASMAYDPSSGTLLLFGGYRIDPATGRTIYLDETWTFDGTAWSLVGARSAPSPRAAAALVYDAVHGELVLFGGFDGRVRLGDTWTWDSSRSRWRAARPKIAPAPVTGPMGFTDPGTGLACVFGGFDGQRYHNETWRWTGRNWDRVTTAHAPFARGSGAVGEDPVLGKVVIFGGIADVNPNNTWTFDGTDWTQENPPTQPPPRYYAAAGYDPGAGGVVLFGGGPGYGDTWLWNGTDWVELLPDASPSARESATAAYDEALGHLVLYGGEDANAQDDDTWELLAP